MKPDSIVSAFFFAWCIVAGFYSTEYFEDAEVVASWLYAQSMLGLMAFVPEEMIPKTKLSTLMDLFCTVFGCCNVFVSGSGPFIVFARLTAVMFAFLHFSSAVSKNQLDALIINVVNILLIYGGLVNYGKCDTLPVLMFVEGFVAAAFFMCVRGQLSRMIYTVCTSHILCNMYMIWVLSANSFNCSNALHVNTSAAVAWHVLYFCYSVIFHED